MAGATEPQPLRRWADMPCSLMRIVLSRKGVDSGSGRIASPILGDWLISLPIPGASQITYADLQFKDISIATLARDLSHGRFAFQFDFEVTYGKLGKGFIDVHHIRPLNQIREGYAFDPKQDLIPGCPNCHAILHQIEPPLSISDLQSRLRRPYG